ncbi:hypothetical protein LYNGBM3L_02650 [Moorena producens 3L]|uniref:Uncharacterized protein n=1 Tax=Moorena producens 3L TaxID=489825 RepID=F4XIL5_9CYAN|nr:hypothetical protein LYNGBM3L_02650 [Moorena producens 3L]
MISEQVTIGALNKLDISKSNQSINQSPINQIIIDNQRTLKNVILETFFNS